MKLLKKIYLGALALLTIAVASILATTEIQELSQHLEKIAKSAGQELLLGSYELQQRYKHFNDSRKSKSIILILRFHYNEIVKKYGHLSAPQWRQALDMMDKEVYSNIFHTYRIKNENWESEDRWSWPAMYYLFSELEKGLDHISKNYPDYLPFSHFLLIRGDVFKTNNTTNAHNIYQILDSIVEFGMTNFYSEQELFGEYDHILAQNGHLPVSLWQEAFNCKSNAKIELSSTYRAYWPDEDGQLYWATGLPTTDMQGPSMRSKLHIIRKMLNIATNNNRGNISYNELLNTLESFYSKNEENNAIIDFMIEDRERLNKEPFK